MNDRFATLAAPSRCPRLAWILLAVAAAGALHGDDGTIQTSWADAGLGGPLPPWEAHASVRFAEEQKSFSVGNQPSQSPGDLYAYAFGGTTGSLEIYSSNLPFVTSFIGWAFVRDPVGSNEGRATQIVVHPGAIVLLGSAATSDGTGFFELRLANGLLFADAFESGSTASWSAP